MPTDPNSPAAQQIAYRRALYDYLANDPAAAASISAGTGPSYAGMPAPAANAFGMARGMMAGTPMGMRALARQMAYARYHNDMGGGYRTPEIAQRYGNLYDAAMGTGVGYPGGMPSAPGSSTGGGWRPAGPTRTLEDVIAAAGYPVPGAGGHVGPGLSDMLGGGGGRTGGPSYAASTGSNMMSGGARGNVNLNSFIRRR